MPLILAAEDDPMSQLLLKEALLEAGMPGELRFVNDGESLIQLLRDLVGDRHDGRPVSVLVLLDLNMPGRGGRQALVDIRGDAALRPLPVVVFSTSNAERDIEFCYREGANSYVVKPLDYNGLLEAIGDMCRFWLRTAVTPCVIRTT
jgi:two-component system response regulator